MDLHALPISNSEFTLQYGDHQLKGFTTIRADGMPATANSRHTLFPDSDPTPFFNKELILVVGAKKWRGSIIKDDAHAKFVVFEGELKTD